MREDPARARLTTGDVNPVDDAVFVPGIDHARTEQHIRASGLSLISLRNGFYSEVTYMLPAPGTGKVPQCCPTIALTCQIFGSAKPTSGYAPIGRDDLALAAAKILESPQAHDDKSYTLAGDKVYSLADLASILTELTGSPVEYVQVPHEAVVDGFAKAFGARPVAEAMASMVRSISLTVLTAQYLAIDNGELAVTSDDFEKLVGRRPIDLREYLQSHGPSKH